MFEGLRRQWLVARGRSAEAAVLYREVLERRPSDVVGLLIVLEDCRMRGDAAEIIRVAGRALEVDPHDFVALKELGWAHATLGNHVAAQDALRRALVRFDALDLANSPRALRGLDRLVTLLALLGWHRNNSKESVEQQTTRQLVAWRAWAQAYVDKRG